MVKGPGNNGEPSGVSRRVMSCCRHDPAADAARLALGPLAYRYFDAVTASPSSSSSRVATSSLVVRSTRTSSDIFLRAFT